MAKTRVVSFTMREASVVLDLLARIGGWTREEMEHEYGWTAADVRAWESALRKVDDACAEGLG